MTEWRYYGRDKETRQLCQYMGLDRPMSERQFSTIVVSGRRQVGKTRLVKEAYALAPNETPLVTITLRDGMNEDQHEQQLRGIVTQSDLPAPIKDLSAIPRYSVGGDRFAATCRHLIEHGVIVCIDEFQNADMTGIDGSLQPMIDNLRFINPPHRPSGCLIVMGSHEQRLQQMLDRTRILHKRFDNPLLVTPWPLVTIVEMAQEQKLLQNPRQFLTLWTAYGGMPHAWERYVTDPVHARSRSLAPGSPEWCMQWLATEHDILCANAQYERFDNAAYIELKPHLHDILMHMAAHPRDKLRVTDFPHDMRPDTATTEQLDADLRALHKHSRLVFSYTPPLSMKNDLVWEIADNPILFQLHVFPELFRRNKTPNASLDPDERPPFDAGLANEWLRTLEGYAFERLIGKWIAPCPLLQWGVRNIETPRHQRRADDTDTNEIDLLLRLGDGSANDVLLAVSAKRDAARQTRQMSGETGMPARLERLLTRATSFNNKMGGLRRKYALISPVWAPQQTARHPHALYLDIPAMTDEMQNDWPCLRTMIGSKPDFGGPGGPS